MKHVATCCCHMCCVLHAGIHLHNREELLKYESACENPWNMLATCCCRVWVGVMQVHT
jgi:hypothetical protein